MEVRSAATQESEAADGDLASQGQGVSAARREAGFRKFPQDVRVSALALVSSLGVSRVARETGLSEPLLCGWRRSADCSTPSSRELAPLEVTRVSWGESRQTGGAVVALLRQGDAVLEIYSVSVAAELGARLWRSEQR